MTAPRPARGGAPLARRRSLPDRPVTRIPFRRRPPSRRRTMTHRERRRMIGEARPASPRPRGAGGPTVDSRRSGRIPRSPRHRRSARGTQRAGIRRGAPPESAAATPDYDRAGPPPVAPPRELAGTVRQRDRAPDAPRRDPDETATRIPARTPLTRGGVVAPRDPVRGQEWIFACQSSARIARGVVAAPDRQ